MKISVFGGSHPAEGSLPYIAAMDLGRRLAQLGHTVLTGGYSGTMEAVSRGAAEAGGHVIGVTCGEVERSYQRTTNPWVREEWKKETLIQRLQALIFDCDAAMALPGGPGTLTEIALMWNTMIVGGLGGRPLILIGQEWQVLFREYFDRLGDYVAPRQRELLLFAGDPPAAVELLSTALPKSGAAGSASLRSNGGNTPNTPPSREHNG
jgi:uncharacterized protein (TIGR00725 family)